MPGVGKKTAERIVLELQDKIGLEGTVPAAETGASSAPTGLSGMVAETVSALTGLGYSEQEVLPVAEAHAGECKSVEDLLRATLKSLGSGR